MLKVSNEELSKIAQFISSVDDMINGKFILADVKITRVLNMIAGSDELYRYISECMIGFDFSREYHRAEAKNSLNGGAFVCQKNLWHLCFAHLWNVMPKGLIFTIS